MSELRIEYAKRRNRIMYFENFGNLRAPKELRYLVNSAIVRLINLTVRTVAGRFVYSFYERLTSSLRTNIALFNSMLVWNWHLRWSAKVASSPWASGRFGWRWLHLWRTLKCTIFYSMWRLNPMTVSFMGLPGRRWLMRTILHYKIRSPRGWRGC